jgi:hypothetical protein
MQYFVAYLVHMSVKFLVFTHISFHSSPEKRMRSGVLPDRIRFSVSSPRFPVRKTGRVSEHYFFGNLT